MGIESFKRKRVWNMLLWGIAVALAVNLGWIIQRGVVGEDSSRFADVYRHPDRESF